MTQVKYKKNAIGFRKGIFIVVKSVKGSTPAADGYIVKDTNGEKHVCRKENVEKIKKVN